MGLPPEQWRREGCTSLGWPEWPQLSRSPARLSAQDAHDLVRHEVWQDDQWQPAERGSLARTVWQAGEIYADGSSFHTGSVLAHAGWGIVRVCDGAPAERVFGPLPGALSQTAPSAEFAALSVAAQLADPSIGMTIRQDCKAAVDIWNRIAHSGNARGTFLKGQQYAGLLRLAVAAHPSTRTSAMWVKGHVDVDSGATRGGSGGLSPSAVLDARGNAWTDDAAKAGARLHPLPDRGEVAALELESTWVLPTIQLAAKALLMWHPARCGRAGGC